MDLLDKKSDFLFDSLCRISKDYLFLSDLKQGTTHFSPNTVADFAIPHSLLHDALSYCRPLIHPEDRSSFDRAYHAFLYGSDESFTKELRIKNRQGEYLWLSCRVCLYRDKNKSPVFLLGLVNRLDSQSKIDPMTKLPNLYALNARITHALSVEDNNAGILLIGIDNFKSINMMYSRTFGDTVLISAAESLSAIRPGDVTLFRAEGDQFVFFCENYSKTELAQLFTYVKSALGALPLSNGLTENLSVSGGGLLLDKTYESVDAVFRALNHALDVSKANGKNKLTFFSHEMLTRSLRMLHIREALRASVADNCRDFRLFFQPIQLGDDKSLVSMEALLRWQNPDFPNVYPDTFIPLLEDTGLILPVGKWIVRTALTQLAEWRQYHPKLCVNINVSYPQLSDVHFGEYVLSELERLKLPPDCLILELTESCEIEDFERVRSFAEFLHAHGIAFALDDFGTGYASISVLREVPADFIKLDHTFVSQIADDNAWDRHIIRYLTMLCHSLGIKVCVEGIENEIVCKLVCEQEPEELQGYFFSRPIPPEQFFEQFIRPLPS